MTASDSAETETADVASAPREGVIHDPLGVSRTPERSARGEEALLARARGLAGRTLGELLVAEGREVPASLARHKGLVGQLIERALGADGGCRGAPDFEALGIECKTLPVGARQVPTETTYVTRLPADFADAPWESSVACAKLARVLFVPVEADPRVPLGARRIGAALLWVPGEDEARVLRQDWDTLREHAALHGVAGLDARLGEALHVRPKAAHGGVRASRPDARGDTEPALPRGLYLRTWFTRRVLERSGLSAARDHNQLD